MFEKTQTFSKTCLFSKIYRPHQKLPFYRIPIFGQKSVGQLLSRKLQESHFIEFPFYQIRTVILFDLKVLLPIIMIGLILSHP